MNTIQFDFASLQPALRRVAAARSTDPDRPILHWVNVHVLPSSVTLYAADGFRLHFERIGRTPSGPESEKVEFCLDDDAVNALLKVKIARRTAPALVLDLDENRITVDGAKIAGSIEWHGYPDVKCVIPQQLRSEITVDSAEFSQAVKTARVFAHDGSNVAQLHITPSSFIVYGCSEENGESFNIVKADYTGSPYGIRLGFNCDFLLSYLKNCTPGTIRIQFNKETMPALLTDSAGFQAVIMPMNIDKGLVLTPESLKGEEKYNPAGAYVYPDSYSCAATTAYNSTQQSAPARVEFESSTDRPYSETDYLHPLPSDWEEDDTIWTGKAADDAQETELQAWYQCQVDDGLYGKHHLVNKIALKLHAPSIPASIQETVNA